MAKPKLSWEDLWEIGTALDIRIRQVEESIQVLAQYDDIVEMHNRELEKLNKLSDKVNSVRISTV